MSYVYFRVLGLGVELQRGYEFFDDGWVKDINVYVQQSTQPHRSLPEHISDAGGITLISSTGQHKQVRIAYEPSPIEYIATGRRAHEETHALHELGQLGILKRRIKEEGYKVPWWRVRDPEKIARIGQVYALLRNGHINANTRELLCLAKVFTKVHDKQ